ncbi:MULTISPECIES: Ku protein [Streptomyces]|uniref:non-homologous end joining protein Ku n=1 Tax=Streptomyces TaxID=1883 RepID=UPI00103E9D83|nr:MULTISPECIES: Ku protein [Streptomyces]MBT3075615.1 Ku protein [Streptomyces sp. COG21]MBT3079872.1 Ku protein [Streptomyces sp. COG20]MBT3089182.1 Ku protein [Streptomyces sp. CYG21]MBT3101001.1 Ku protein [Streptomyces sp. CBG30]MBT3106255.1 Ku protein [Streptomyces sp. COG19]
MRSIWNGAISFGLVSIPIKLVNATENHSIHFRQIHLADGGRIRYRKVCELDEEEVSGGEIGKAYEDADGTMIPITDEDLAQLPLPTAKTIEIVAFVPADEIDPLQLDTAYYLSANGVPAAKPYTLLREALKRSNKVAVAKFALRGRERLGMLRVVDDVIAMHGLLWPDEIRAPEGVAPEGDVTVRDAELDLADALMDTLGEVDMDSLHDDYREAVEELIAAKASGEAVEPSESQEPGGGKVIDLIAALESSVRAAKKSRGEGQEDGEDEEAGAEGDMAEVHPIKKRAAKKSTAARPRSTPKETGAKKSTASGSSTAGRATQKQRKTTSSSAKKASGRGTAKSTAGTATKSTAKSATKSTAKSGGKTPAKGTKKTASAPRKRASA